MPRWNLAPGYPARLPCQFPSWSHFLSHTQRFLKISFSRLFSTIHFSCPSGQRQARSSCPNLIFFACPHIGSFTPLHVSRSCFLAYSASTGLFLLKPLSRHIHRSSSRLRLLFQTYLFEEPAFVIALTAEILKTALLNFEAEPFVDGLLPAPHGGRGWYNIMRHILS